MGEKKIKIIVYTVIAIFILSTAYFALSLYLNFKTGDVRAQSEFVNFLNQIHISDDFFQQNGSIENLQNLIDNNSYISAALLSIDKSVEFAYPVSSSSVQINSSNMPILMASSPFIKTFSSTMYTQSGHPAELSAAVYLLRTQDIYDSARISFLIILACTLFVLIMILYLSLSVKKEDISNKYEEAVLPFSEKTDEPETIPITFRDRDDLANDFLDIDENIETEPPQEEIDTYTSDFTKDCENDFPTEELQAEKESGDPMGLFSDETGVSWESYMETRLDAELTRATAAEQDLALVIVRLREIESNKNLLKKVATLLLDYFKFRDFIFEYKDDGFAGIILNSDLDQTMVLVENLHSRLKALLREENEEVKIAIGLSTRSLRIIPGSRIITEAREAAEKAFTENDLPIVAFRVNPEKYRQFLSNILD
ncbi:MAG: hypothetical protein R3Y36_00260 [Spirochaetales bacterium]